MLNLKEINNPYNDDKVISACSIFGMMNTTGERFSGKDIITAIANMHVRGNGLGGGFAIYGLYPEFPDNYVLHIMYESKSGKNDTESFLQSNFHILKAEPIPTKNCPQIKNPPFLWRYFLEIPAKYIEGICEEDYIIEKVIQINSCINDAFVFSSGKDMGVFKGVGYPEEIAEFFMLDKYSGYLWTAHGRFPTNSRGWWGGAHPFNILDWSVVHNGEISSYGINRRYLEQFGYICSLETDTEVIAYAVDLLLRKHNLPVEIMALIFAPPFWHEIEHMEETEESLITSLRQTYASLLLNGPFAIIITDRTRMIGLTDRIRLRPLVAGIKNETLFLSSEESAIRRICPALDYSWIPFGGEPIIGEIGKHPSRINWADKLDLSRKIYQSELDIKC